MRRVCGRRESTTLSITRVFRANTAPCRPTQSSRTALTRCATQNASHSRVPRGEARWMRSLELLRPVSGTKWAWAAIRNMKRSRETPSTFRPEQFSYSRLRAAVKAPMNSLRSALTAALASQNPCLLGRREDRGQAFGTTASSAATKPIIQQMCEKAPLPIQCKSFLTANATACDTPPDRTLLPVMHIMLCTVMDGAGRAWLARR